MIKNLTKYWAVWVLVIFIASVSWPLSLPGYFSHHDDLQIMRIFEMRRCLIDAQIPCRWVPDMGYGNGFPLFNYYSALPYYIGAVLSFLLGYIWSAKVLFFIPLILGGFSMYLLGKELFGKIAGIVSAVLYLFAPYLALDLYVRGAVAESFALSIVPLVFYFILRLIKQSSFKNFAGLSVSFAAFLISHNIMTLFFAPIIFLWTLCFSYSEKLKRIWLVFIGLILGFGMAAFFILPAFFEKSLVQSDSLIQMDLNFRANFVAINQLFLERFWGYGASTFGSNDTISFQIGWPHWWLMALSIPFLIIGIFTRKLKLNQILLPVFLIVIFCFSVFMTHNQSAFIWEKIDVLKYAQFPWRFLSLAVFTSSLIGGFFVFVLRNKGQQVILASVIIFITVFLNWSYFKPDKFYLSMTDQEKLTGSLWEDQQKAAITDYLPKTALEPREKAPNSPLLVSGKAEISSFANYSNKWFFKTNVIETSKIDIPVFDFPNWQVSVNGSDYPHNHQNLIGRINIDLPPGSYEVSGNFKNTQLRTFADTLSLISLGLLILFSYGKFKKIFI
ncbi:MAG: 6-pyruvoyl-tetrahydropterin synthase-related protein [Microgenomates group bacterium]|jgi:hypothetical protein